MRSMVEGAAGAEQKFLRYRHPYRLALRAIHLPRTSGEGKLL